MRSGERIASPVAFGLQCGVFDRDGGNAIRGEKSRPCDGVAWCGGGCAVERTLQQLPHIHVQRVRQSQSIGEGDVAHLTLALLDALDLSFIDAGPR